MSGAPQPKQGTPAKPRRRGMARPEDALALHCESSIEDVCTGWATERHHVLRRSQGGTDERSNTLDICSPCHLHIHANPTESYRRGFLKRGSA